MDIIVCKFGGSSMATGKIVKTARDIINEDKLRKLIVVSAPGKRFEADIKITDMLIDVYNNKTNLNDVKHRFVQLIDEFLNEIKNEFGFFILGFVKNKLLAELNKEFEIIATSYKNKNLDYLASRGEFLMSRMFAVALGFQFVDSKDLLLFLENGEINVRSEILKPYLNKGIIVPGFYGADENGNIKTFSRGGGDITGAYLAKELDAIKYENWTDVDGVFDSDPNVMNNGERPNQPFERLTYEQLQNISGVVVHKEAVEIMSKTKIPLVVKNTFNKNAAGTIIN